MGKIDSRNSSGESQVIDKRTTDLVGNEGNSEYAGRAGEGPVSNTSEGSGESAAGAHKSLTDPADGVGRQIGQPTIFSDSEFPLDE